MDIRHERCVLHDWFTMWLRKGGSLIDLKPPKVHRMIFKEWVIINNLHHGQIGKWVYPNPHISPLFLVLESIPLDPWKKLEKWRWWTLHHKDVELLKNSKLRFKISTLCLII